MRPEISASAMCCALFMMLASPAALAQNYVPAFAPQTIEDAPIGPKNEVVVLASPHLSYLPDSFEPEMTDPLVARFAGWSPSAIAVETTPGLRCMTMRQMPTIYDADSVESYCFDPSSAGKAAKLDVFEATAAAEAMLSEWPAGPSFAQRRNLALVFLAAGEPGSALVQWLYLPESERIASDGLTDQLVDDLEKRRTCKSEVSLIAARVAVAAGLERLWGVDDQAYYAGPVDSDAYGQTLSKAWDNPATAYRTAQTKALNEAFESSGTLLPMYRAYNAPEYAAKAYESDWGAALTEPSAERYGRRYVAYWETRNLRMAANIREVLGRNPGSRLLAIVGASHKGYYEAYLNQMRDVELVDVMPMLE